MDVKQRMAAYLPDAIASVEKHGPLEIAELWLMARAYRASVAPRRRDGIRTGGSDSRP